MQQNHSLTEGWQQYTIKNKAKQYGLRMSEENEQDRKSPNVEGSYIEGGAEIKDGDFVGRDKHVGLSGKEVADILDVLIKHFSSSYLRKPDQLDEILSNYQSLHQKLHEWKELHNHMDRILQAFEQFSSQAVNASVPLDIRELRNLWFPVNLRVDELLSWAETITRIGEKYQVLENNTRTGEMWAIDVENKRDDLSTHLGISNGLTSNNRGFPHGSLTIRRLRHLFGLDSYWWNELVDLTHQMRHLVLQNMHIADKQLRETATALFLESKNALLR
jgi:hypothetical protein